MKKIVHYYIMYGNIVMSIKKTKEEAERLKQYYIDYKVVRYPEILTIEEYCPFVSLNM